MTTPNVESLAETSALLAGGGEPAAAAARALRSLSLQPATRDAALALGAVPAVLPYLRRAAEPALKTTLTQTFSNFCRRADGEAAVQLKLVSPALPLLKDLLYDEDTDVLEAACTAVINLTHGPNNGVEAVQAVAGLTERLVTLMRHEASNVKKAALSAVANMLSGTTAQVKRCLDAGCLEHFARLLQSTEPDLVKRAAMTTCNVIVSYPFIIERTVEKDIVTPLLNILANGEPECQMKAAEAISKLCWACSVPQSRRLVSIGVLQLCGAALDRIAGEPPAGADDPSLTLTVVICWRILRELYKCKEHIEAAQAVPGLTARLLALLGHKDVRVQRAALSAMKNMLTGTEAQVKRCLDAGCLEHLERLLRSTDPELLVLAALATYNIFDTNSHSLIERVLEKDIITLLLNILAFGELECRVQAAETIAKLCDSCTAEMRARAGVSRSVLQRCIAVFKSMSARPGYNRTLSWLTTAVKSRINSTHFA